MKRMIGILLIVLLMVGCSGGETPEQVKPVEADSEPVVEAPSESEEPVVESPQISKGLDLGQIYSDSELSYNILKFRPEAEDGHLFITMEVRNDTGENLSFVAMERLLLKDQDGNECTYEMFVTTDQGLGGEIPAGNKIQGEVAFTIPSFEDEEYTLALGKFYSDYKDAFTFKPSDFSIEYNSVFENSKIESDYTIGVPVESDVFTITLNAANIEPCDEEGMELLSCDFTFDNHTANDESFLIGFMVEPFDSEGIPLELDEMNMTLYQSVSPNSSESGIVPYKVKEGTRDFYFIVTPDLREQMKTYYVVFEVE